MGSSELTLALFRQWFHLAPAVMMLLRSVSRLLSTLVISNVLVTRLVADSCRVYSGLGEPCIFPFVWNGTFYAECTSDFNDGSEAMCPTKLGNEITLEATNNPAHWGVCSKECNLKHYNSNQQVYDKIVQLGEEYKSIAKPFIIGRSMKNQPMVRLVANIGGNEVVGREILLQLGQHLLMGYQLDERITKLIDTTDISILPSLNPDGYDRAQEGECSGSGKNSGSTNENDVDINDDFPTIKDWDRFNSDLTYDPFSGGRQAETLAVMNWSTQPFVISANLHDGAVLITYPFDHFQQGKRGAENVTPDNDIFHHLSTTYSTRHKTMSNGTSCYRRAKHDDGVENGASWYSRNSRDEIVGSLKDFSYLFTNNMEISLELACCKFPKSYFLLQEWEKNKDSLLSYIEQVHMGIKGLVSLEGNSLHQGAEVIVWNPDGSRRGKNMLTSEFGEYWRVLLPGQNGNNTYAIQAKFEDCDNGGSGRIYESLKHRIIVSENRPLKLQDLRMRAVGYCGVEEITNTLDVLSDLERFRGESQRQAAESIEDDIFESELHSFTLDS